MPEPPNHVAGEQAAQHPIYAPGVDPAIRREYDDLKAERDKWLSWHARADSEAERYLFRAEELERERDAALSRATQAEQERDSLRLELDAAESARVRDNRYLIGERDEAKQARAQAERRVEELEAWTSQADELLRRLAEWDVMNVMGDGKYWKQKTAAVRSTLEISPSAPDLPHRDQGSRAGP